MLILFIGFTNPAMAADTARSGEFLVLAYHAVTAKPSPDDEYSISQGLFAEQMEYLRTHGYQPVSLDDILKAHRGEKALPEKAVLLTL